MTEIPTMACQACSGFGGFLVLRGQAFAGRHPCPHCDGTGRIPRPPLTAEEITALPDGARLVVETTNGDVGYANWWRSRRYMYRSTEADLPCSSYAPDECRAWLADDQRE